VRISVKFSSGNSYVVTGRRERRRKQLLDFLKEIRGYWRLKEEALNNTL
jgi:hypothetical protein